MFAFIRLLDYYVIRPILFYYILYCPNPASGLQYPNKHIYLISRYLRNDAALSEKLQLLAAPLRFIAPFVVNPRENSCKRHMHRNHSFCGR